MNTGTQESTPRQKKNKSPSFVKLVNWKWAATAFLSSLMISIVMSLLSSEVMNYTNLLISILILVSFVMLGVIFDIIGLAVATTDIKPFNSMSARKVRGGKQGVALIKNAEKVSSFCNDIIGDICGIVSGSVATAISLKIVQSSKSTNQVMVNLLICGLVSAFTVGLKAVGKTVGMNYGKPVVTAVAKTLSMFEKKTKVTKKAKK